MITVAHGREWTSKALDAWAEAHRITLEFIRPGNPMDNAGIASCNGRVREEW
ncbi:MAG: transposase [Nitrospirae bacterium]|nr:MAG: transposase [Nitrospirota bacterium]